MKQQEEIRVMKEWYSKSYVCYEMLYTQMFDREIMFMMPKHRRQSGLQTTWRYINIFKPQGIPYFLHHMILFSSENITLNAYSTLAKYKDGVPIFKGNPMMRKRETETWHRERWKTMTSYDLLIDVDADDRTCMDLAKQATLQIIKFLDEYNMPYYLRFSGMGYHVIIPYRYFKHVKHHFNPDEDLNNSIYNFCAAIQRYFYDNHSEMVDTGVHDFCRVSKIPYSLTFYPDGCYVCWPFRSITEFITHKHTDYKLSNHVTFPGEQKIFRRGQTLFNKDSWTEEDTDRMLKKMRIENGSYATKD